MRAQKSLENINMNKKTNKEKICVTYTTEGGQAYRITQNLINGTFILYKQIDNKWVDTKKKAYNPLDLEKYME